MNRSLLFLASFVAVLSFALPSEAAKDKEKGWVELASRKVDFKGDHDVIEVGKSEGKFTTIRLEVEDGDMVLEKMKITFGDGSTFEPDTKAEFKEGRRTHNIDLPGERRIIKKVEFKYHSERRRESTSWTRRPTLPFSTPLPRA